MRLSSGSLTGTQLFALIGAFVILVFFLGFIAELFLAPFGTIFASVVASLAVIGASNGMKSSNIRNFLELQREAREESNDAPAHVTQP